MRLRPFLLLLPVIALGGCGTMDGLKNDIAQSYKSVTRAIAKVVDPAKEAKKKLPVYDGTCPQVSVRPDLARIVDFQSEKSPTSANITSEAVITNVQNICRVENNALVMQIDLSLEGKIGPKGRIKSNDQPNFAYPYFVAVTGADGTVLFKEIFAVTFAYERDQNSLKQVESIFQNMPFPDSAAGEIYHVVLGFQLSEAQLNYNSGR